MKRSVNFYIGALVITVVGSIATLLIVQTAFEAEAIEYGSTHYQQKSGEVPTVKEELEREVKTR